MQRKFILKISFYVAVIGVFFPLFFSCQLCLAEEVAKLKSLNLERIEEGLRISLEHTKPVVYKVEEIDTPPRLYIYIQGAKITFQTYNNIPIEIPVKEKGIKAITVEEKTDYRLTPPQMVKITIDLTQPVNYEVDSQWNGQFISIKIAPKKHVPQRISWTEREIEIAPSRKIEEARKSQEEEAKKIRVRLAKIAEEKRSGKIKQEAEERLAKVRKEAEERMKSGKTLEKAYEKLKAETQVSKLPSMREQILEKGLYKDITMPTEVTPIVRRIISFTEVKSLDDCISLATANYMPLQIAKEQEQLAKLRVREARRAFYPAFLAEMKEIDGRTITEDYRGRTYGFQAQQPVFTGGKLTATLHKEQLSEFIAKSSLDRVKQDLIFNVSKTYYELVVAKNTLDILKELKIESEKLLEEMEKEFNIGSATPALLLTAQSLHNQICYQVASLEREVVLAKLNLEKEMFTENLNVDNLNYNLSLKKIDDANLQNCIDLAFKNRPEPKILELTIKAAKYGEDIITSETFPNVAVVGTYGRSGEAYSNRDLALAKEWSIMGQVKWFLGGNTVETSFTRDRVSPYKVTRTDTHLSSDTYNTKFSFWDNLAHFTKQKEAQITRKQAEKDLAEMKNKIRQETEDGYYSYLKYNTQLAMALNEIGFRRKQLEIIKAKRKMNEAAVPELMEASLQLAQAQANYYQALGGIRAAIVGLNRAIGVINYF